MDPRAWVSLAVALDESKVDSKFGVFVNVQLLPTGEKYTAIVPAVYAGEGFGLYAPIHKDDDLVVAIPSGDPKLGIVVVSRMWTAADTPPADAKSDPNDVLLVVEEGKNLRLKVQGSGNVNLIVADGMVNLGEESPSDFVALAQKVLDQLDLVKNWASGHTHPAAMGTTGPPNQPFPTLTKPAAEKVKAK